MNIELTASRARLKEVNARVKQHFPRVDVLQGCWTLFSLEDNCWHFHGPAGYILRCSAKNAYDCRAKGWEAYLKFKGVG